MLQAAFIGRGVDRDFRKTVCKILRKQVGVSEFSAGRAVGRCNSDLFVFFERCPAVIRLCGAVVFLNRCSGREQIAGERLCVCNSAQETDVALARKSGGDVITCGMSLRDSITFSSCAESRCVIGVQRSINRLDGSRAEPFELPADCTPQDDRYGILCAYLLLILAGFF